MRTTWRLSLAAAALLGLLALSGRAADRAKPNTLTDQEKADGWKLLFDGKTTDGWRAFKGKDVPEVWKVIDDALVVSSKNGKGGGDIVTEEQYDNFDLAFEWKVTKGANSGVMYRVSEKGDAPYVTGPEYQILDNKGHADGKKLKTSAASAYDVYAPSEDATKPVGEWNKSRIVVNGNHVEHWLNGKKVVEYEFGSDDWNEHVAAGKFKDAKSFGKEKKGHIDLQWHGDEVAYRNIKIKVLSGSK
jgi:Domain of Unknown Function (DUF1080)